LSVLSRSSHDRTIVHRRSRHARHADAWFEPSRNFAFTAEINAVPLMAVEFQHAAAEFAIVFSQVGSDIMPAAVLGVRGQQNLYLTEDAHWRAKYVPAFIRRYPFVFSSSEDQQTLTLCIDETHPGFNREGRGQRLFGDDGKPSAYVEQVLKFLQEYQTHFERTRSFGKKLQTLNLLEWTSPAVRDSSEPHLEALSKASGLTPPRWPCRRVRL
jgi:hypothetical protein